MIERAKIYGDGNHFIAIPETKSENRKRKSVVPKQYTDEERKALDKRNLLIRKIRFVRKAYLNRFNYFATATYFYGHSFNLDNNPPNISPFRLEWVAQRKSEVNGKNCY